MVFIRKLVKLFCCCLAMVMTYMPYYYDELAHHPYGQVAYQGQGNGTGLEPTRSPAPEKSSTNSLQGQKSSTNSIHGPEKSSTNSIHGLSGCLAKVYEAQPRLRSDRKCQVLTFINQLNNNLTSDVDLDLLARCHYVFYNAVPKCGSRSLNDLFKELSMLHNYTTYTEGDNMGMNPYKKGKVAVDKYIMRNERNIPTFKRRHLFFLDFVRQTTTPRAMINIIREPVGHVISVYNWLSFGDGVRNHSKIDSSMSLGDCLSIHGANTSKCIKWRLLPMPYFHGNGGGIHPNPSVLQTAKRHVEDTFLLVGVMEDMPTFVNTLELMLPHLFCNATRIYHEIEEESLKSYQTQHKRQIRPSTRALLERHLAYNIDLYQFVKQRFYHISERIRRQLANTR